MNIMSEKDCSDGWILREWSEIDETIKGWVMLDAIWIVTKRDVENTFSYVFSSEDYQSGSFEIAFKLFKALSGVKLNGSLGSSKFS